MLNRKDYRKYISYDCKKCDLWKNGERICSAVHVKDYPEFKCSTLREDGTVIFYVFKLIKKDKDNA